MLNNGGFTQPCNSRNCLATVGGGAASFSTSFINKPHLFLVPKPSPSFSVHCKTGSLSSQSRQFQQTRLRFRAVSGEKRGVLCVFAQKKGKGSTGEVDVEDFEDDEEDFDDFDDVEDEEEDEDVGELLPIEKMKQWLVKKPTGFGEGKAYDTSVEEKLLAELEKTRQAQAINIRNLKLNPVNPNSKKGDKKKKKETGATPSGIRVRVSNLPKKKNIHRDLESAFKGFAGIVNITPVVSGTKKTRDPICKGYGFIDFKSEKDASRFIEMFSKQTIAFGKVQKQVKYEMVNSRSSSNVTREKSSNASNFAPGKRLSVLEKSQDVEKISDESNKPDDGFVTSQADDIEDDDDLVISEMEDNEDDDLVISEMEDIEDDDHVVAEMEDSEDDELVTAEIEDIEDDDLVVAEMEDSEDDELVTAEIEDTEDDEFLAAETEDAKDDVMEPTVKSQADSSSSKKPLKLKATKEMQIVEDSDRERIKLLEQRLLARIKGEKIPKLEIQGSAKWLKVKEEMGQRKQDKPKPKEKQQNAKAKGGKARKFDVPVSAKRLRVREKAVLTEVFTKYGAKGGLALKEEK